MKNPGNNNNMFAEAKKSALAPFERAVDGPIDAAVCVAFAEGLDEEGRAALSAACAGLGFPDPVFLNASGIGSPGALAQKGRDNAAADAGAKTEAEVEAGIDAEAEAKAEVDVAQTPHPVDRVLLDAAAHREKGLFAAIEALDPLMLVVADALAADLLARAYREPIVVASHGFVFGRPYAAFSSFQRDLRDPRMKQRNWALLKAMRKNAHWLG
ncbi:MAG: hypothetical protein Q4D92_08255 [Slackia sp.]|nr:hypothetical protein [Slackia sp.]